MDDKDEKDFSDLINLKIVYVTNLRFNESVVIHLIWSFVFLFVSI